MVASMVVACSSSSFTDNGDAGVSPDSGAPPITSDASTSETAYSRLVVGDSPLLYWRLDEGSGATARDYTSNMLDGTYTPNGFERGQPSLVGDVNASLRISPGASIDGTNDARLGFVGQAAFSVECWISIPQPPTAIQTIVARSSDTATSGYQMWVDPTGALRAYFGRYEAGTGATVASDEGTPLVIGETYHFVAVYDGAKLKLHVNGVAATDQKDSAAALTEHNYKLRVGRGEDLEGTLNARLDELAVYSKALPADRIQAHYDLGKKGDR
jgi:trimeric autotransporter adhesin